MQSFSEFDKAERCEKSENKNHLIIKMASIFKEVLSNEFNSKRIYNFTPAFIV